VDWSHVAQNRAPVASSCERSRATATATCGAENWSQVSVAIILDTVYLNTKLLRDFSLFSLCLTLWLVCTFSVTSRWLCWRWRWSVPVLDKLHAVKEYGWDEGVTPRGRNGRQRDQLNVLTALPTRIMPSVSDGQEGGWHSCAERGRLCLASCSRWRQTFCFKDLTRRTASKITVMPRAENLLTKHILVGVTN
jgi:hypothetical protein